MAKNVHSGHVLKPTLKQYFRRVHLFDCSGNLKLLQLHAGVVIGKLVKIQHGPATVSAEELLIYQPLSLTGWEGEQLPMTRKSGDRPA